LENHMTARVLILGAGFGGLELSTRLSESLGNNVDVTLIDKSDSFVFGFSKLDLMFGREAPDAIRIPYARIAKPGVRFVQESVTRIDAEAKRVTTDGGVYEADYLVIALGADYDIAATPGLAEFGNEFYSVAGATVVRDVLPRFTGGRAIVGVCGAPYKCPPAPSEAALMLHDYLGERGRRDHSEITIVLPWGTPVPPSPDTSAALIAAFAERGIRYLPARQVMSLDGRVAVLDDGLELPYDLFLGIPKHRAPAVVEESGLLDGKSWIPVNPRTLETRVPGVYAVGDVSSPGTVPKAGVFAEGAGKSVASRLIASISGRGERVDYPGAGSCYIEFGGGRVGRVDVDFFSGPKPTGKFQDPSMQLRAEKDRFGSSRRMRWFGE
jgi:sulfide:quinone oxidoreductase